jgi:hypothetical protein
MNPSTPDPFDFASCPPSPLPCEICWETYTEPELSQAWFPTDDFAPENVAPPPRQTPELPVLPENPIAESNSGPKKNKIKKGFGPDSKSDEDDGYNFQLGYFYQRLKKFFGRTPPAGLVFEICQRVLKGSAMPLTDLNRWGRRRMGNAYAWLDRNQGRIPDQLFERCYYEAKWKLKI